MGSFYIPLTGLETNSTALNTIANNLANLNTTGYKSQSTHFSDTFYQELGLSGGGNQIQLGSGARTVAIEADRSQGSIASTGNATDVAINGNGFFVLNNGGSNIYTRDGNFGLDFNGNLVTQQGLAVMGYPAVGGVVNNNSPLTGIHIPVGQVEPPQASSNFTMTANLNATAAVGTAVPGQITLYDSLGHAHVATITYTKTSNNNWNYSIALPAGEAAAAVNNTGTLTFNSNGTLTAPAANVAGISFTGLTDGASNLTFNWNILGSNGTPTLTQVDAASGVSATSQDGYASGQYQDFTIAADGTVNVTFSNGQHLAVGQLAMANVANLQGLQQLGTGDYATTLASGSANIGVANAGGLGNFEDSALEQSNVNISGEFSQLIIAQRAFEANSKAVTTFDTLAQETINMIH